MGEKILKYSVLRYKPSSLSGESINLGVLYQSEVDDFVSFKYIQRMGRLSHFDDEIDIRIVMNFLKSINQEVTALAKKGEFNLDTFIMYYTNGFCFDKSQVIFYDDIGRTIEYVDDVYLRFDKIASERKHKGVSDQKLLADLFKANDIKVKKNSLSYGKFNEPIRYDFETDTLCVKFFDFDKKNLSNSIRAAKIWAWNGMYSKKDLIIVYRYENEDYVNSKDFEIIMKIFESAGIKTCNVSRMEDILKRVG